MQEDHTPERLLTAVAREEPDALRQLFVQTSPKLFAITSRICRDQTLAEKALQETFTAVWRRASAFDARQTTGMTWLAQIARNRAVSLESRTPQVAAAETGTYQADEVTLPDLATARVDYPELDKLMVSLDQLDDKSRQSLLLAYYEGLPREELAQRVEMPAGVLTKHLRRGLNKLNRLLSRTG